MKCERAEIRLGIISQVSFDHKSFPVGDPVWARQMLYNLGYRLYYEIREQETGQQFKKEIWGRFAPESEKKNDSNE